MPFPVIYHLRGKNLRSFLKQDMDMPAFWAYLKDTLAGSGMVFDALTPRELAQVEQLKAEKYDTWEWNFGNSPRYGFNQSRRFPWGFIEVSLDVAGGVIRSCSIHGDYFFTRPTEEVEQALTGLPHSYSKVLDALSALPLNDCFGPVSPEELTSLFF
mgnify:CR=1 FL=1